ncbi:MAG: hypothetical protein ABI224_14985 [Acetobacteraceae bacterium]
MSDDPTARILAAIERLDAGQNKLRGDLMARMDRLQDALTLQSDIRQLKGEP